MEKENEIFELMTKMYADLTGQLAKMHDEFTGRFDAIDSRFESVDSRFEAIDSRFEAIDSRFESMDSRFDRIEKKLDEKADKQDIIRLENKQDNDAKALYDGYIQTFEKLQVIENKVDNLTEKVERHDIDIAALK